MSLINQLIADEGLKLFPYKDTAGKITIGIGRNLDDNGISEDEVYLLCQNDINRCELELMNNFIFYGLLSTERKEVLINMCFNLGISRLKRFKKMIICLENGDYVGAAKEMKDSNWYHQVGDRADRLIKKMEE